jgi:hypothetical protein
MQSAQLKNHFKQHELDAVILSYADSNHYLAGGLDQNGDYHLLADKKGNTMTFKSLREAEIQLFELGATKAILDMETAYDEMVGAAPAEHGRIELTLSN